MSQTSSTTAYPEPTANSSSSAQPHLSANSLQQPSPASGSHLQLASPATTGLNQSVVLSQQQQQRPPISLPQLPAADLAPQQQQQQRVVNSLPQPSSIGGLQQLPVTLAHQPTISLPQHPTLSLQQQQPNVSLPQPLPQSALISPPSLDLPRAPPPLDLQNLGLSPSSHEDADEQISKLLKNQHQQPGARKEDHKQQLPPAPAAASATPSAGGTSFDVFDAARQRTKVSSGSLKSPEPPVINPVKSAIAKSAAASLFNDNVPSPSMPVLLPQVPISSEKATGFQKSYLDSLAKSQIGDKRAGNRTRNSSGLTMAVGLGPAPAPTGISHIESKSVKTPQDEAVLASLQAKQHQILSTGRPVNPAGPAAPPPPPGSQAPSHHPSQHTPPAHTVTLSSSVSQLVGPPPPLQAPQLTDELLETAPFSSADDTEADIKRLQENKVTLREVNVFSLLLFSVIKGSMQDKLKVFFSVIFWRPISVEEVIV